MGADFVTYKVTAKNENELNIEADRLRDEGRYEYGHGGYTGTIAEDSGSLLVVEEEMSPLEASEHIKNNAEKWGDTLAVKLKDTADQWLIGGVYSS